MGLVPVSPTAVVGLQRRAGNAAVSERLRVQRGKNQGVEKVGERPGLGVEKKKHKRGKQKPFAEQVARRLTAKGWTRFGGARNLVLFKVTPTGQSLGLDQGMISQIHDETANVVPRKCYEPLRAKQALRWASTVAYAYLAQTDSDPREVQAALSGAQAYIASNTRKGNRKLTDVQEENKSGLALLGYMADQLEMGNLDDREKRHLSKLRNRILSDRAGKSQRYAGAIEAFSKDITVVTAGEEGLHAERRIALHLDIKPLPADSVGGVKRPCAACYLELFKDQPGVHPGPFWPSKASNVGIGAYEQEDADAAAMEVDTVVNTYVTRQGTTVTHGYDTDSDSEADD